MAILTRTIRGFRTSLLILTVTVVWLLFIHAVQQPAVGHPAYQQFKAQNDLNGYLNQLFDQTDENPSLAGQADSLLQTLWRAAASPAEKLTYYQLLTNIAYHLLQSGQIKSSTRWYEAAFRFYQSHQSDAALVAEMNVEEYVCKPLGNNYTRMGDFSKAIVIQQWGVASAIRQGKKQMLAALYANLATTHFYLQDYASVQAIANTALAALNGTSSPAALLLYNLKTETYFETDQRDSARYWNQKALDYPLPSSEHTPWRVTALINRSRLLNEQNAYSGAMAFLQQAWALSWSLNTKEKAKLSNEIGITLAHLNQPARSKQWFEQTLRYFKRDHLNLYPDFNTTAAMFGLARCYDAAQQPDSASYWSTQAVLNDHYTQQLIDAWLFSKSSLYSNARLTESAIAWHHDYYEKTKDPEYLLKALWMAELSKGRMLMYEQQRSKSWQQDTMLSGAAFDELRNDYLLLAQATTAAQQGSIKERIAQREFALSLNKKTGVQPPLVPTYQQFLKWLFTARQNSCILSYYVTSGSVYIVKADAHGVTHKVDATGAGMAALSTFVRQYFYDGPQAFNNNPADYYAQSAALVQKYIPDMDPKPTEYIISPSGLLHQLPFEALSIDARAPVFIGRDHTVRYQFSLLQLIGAQEGSRSALEIFSFGKAHLGFPALRQAVQEAAYLKKRYKAQQHDATQATNEHFFKALEKGNLIHLASHAVAGSGTDQPYILLKEKLYLGQLQYQATNCPLIVLAACETGKGASLQNEGMLSLGRTFISKGVRGVLATRWQVDDVAASEIIQYFYDQLGRERRPAQALQKARRQYLEAHPAAAEQNPWLWAAFYYQGGNQEIELEQAGAPVWTGVAVLVLLVLGQWLYRRFRKKEN